MQIDVSDESVKRIGDEVIRLVSKFRKFRNSPAKESEKKAELKELFDRDLDDLLKEETEIELTKHYAEIIGHIGFTIHQLGGSPLFDRVMEYIENDPRDAEIHASVLFARRSDPALWYRS